MSCATEFISSDNSINESPVEQSRSYPHVDQKLWSYFEDFELAAANRNINIDLVDLEISGVIENISEDGVAGTCQYGQHIHHVTIDLPVWNRSSLLVREMIVFHELGHCALGRGHKEIADSNGACLSMMNSGTTDCRVYYTNVNKEYYLDELFSEERI